MVEKKIEKKKPVGPVIIGPPTLNGARVELTRGGKLVKGVLMSRDGQNSNDKLVFKWSDGEGPPSISPLTGAELDKLLHGESRA